MASPRFHFDKTDCIFHHPMLGCFSNYLIVFLKLKFENFLSLTNLLFVLLSVRRVCVIAKNSTSPSVSSSSLLCIVYLNLHRYVDRRIRQIRKGMRMGMERKRDNLDNLFLLCLNSINLKRHQSYPFHCSIWLFIQSFIMKIWKYITADYYTKLFKRIVSIEVISSKIFINHINFIFVKFSKSNDAAI